MRRNLDMNQLMKQAQKMQADLVKKQDEVKQEVVSATAGGGMVKVKMNGNYDLVELVVAPEIVDPSDVEMLVETIIAAIKDAKGQVEAMSADQMSQITGGMKIPGLG